MQCKRWWQRAGGAERRGAQALAGALDMVSASVDLRSDIGQGRGAQAREAAAAGQAALIEPEREFIICALDLVSGLAEGLGAGLEALVGRSMLRPLLVQCCQDPSADVRQSAFALVGDLSKACQPHLAPIAGDLIALGVASLQPAMIRQVRAAGRHHRCKHTRSAPGKLVQVALVFGLSRSLGQQHLCVRSCRVFTPINSKPRSSWATSSCSASPRCSPP